LYGLGYTPEYIVYHEVTYTTKEYMQNVTAVEPYWLAEMGPMFFSVRELGTDIHAVKRQELEDQRRMDYEQKLRDDLERQSRREEEEKGIGGGKVLDIGVKKRTGKLKELPAAEEETNGATKSKKDENDSGSDGEAAKRRRRGGPPKKVRRMMVPS